MSSASAFAAPVVHTETRIVDRYYAVTGANADQVFDAIRRRGLGGTPGRAASGVTEATLSSSVQVSSAADRPCRVESVRLTLTIEVTLPRHTTAGMLDASTRQNWELYATGVEAHEYEHVGIEERGLRDVERLIEQALSAGLATGDDPRACQDLVSAILQDGRKTTDERHRVFHRDEARWLRDSQALAREEIAGVDAELAEHLDAIATLDDTIGALRAEQASLQRALALLIAELGPALPEPRYSEARALEGDARRVAGEANALIDERNGIAEAHRRLVDVRRQLAENAAWLR